MIADTPLLVICTHHSSPFIAKRRKKAPFNLTADPRCNLLSFQLMDIGCTEAHLLNGTVFRPLFIDVPFIFLSFCSKITYDTLDAPDTRDAGALGEEEDVNPQQTDEIPQTEGGQTIREEEPLLEGDGGVSIMEDIGVSIKEAIGRKYGGAVRQSDAPQQFEIEIDEVNTDHFN